MQIVEILTKIASNKKCPKAEITWAEDEILKTFELTDACIESHPGIQVLKFYNKPFAKINLKNPDRIEGFSSYTKVFSPDFWKRLGTQVLAQKKNLSSLEEIKNKSLDPSPEIHVPTGSEIAKSGFDYEELALKKFNQWSEDEDVKIWLMLLDQTTSEVLNVVATQKGGRNKSDIRVQITRVDSDKTFGISIKKTSAGFSQLDKRWVVDYQSVWAMPADVAELLKFYTGENEPKNYLGCPEILKDPRRLYLNEMKVDDVAKILLFFETNKELILSDIFQGRGEYRADSMLVYDSIQNISTIKTMREVIDHYSQGVVEVSSQGGLNFLGLTIQRKGGDSGKDTAKMLQFKFNPKFLLK